MKNVLFFFFAFLISTHSYSQDGVRFSVKEKVILVNPADNSFSENVYYEGKCKSNVKNKGHIYFGELQAVKDIRAHYNISGKWEKVSKKTFSTSSLLTSAFYTGIQKTTIPFPNQAVPYRFRYSYKMETQDLLFLSLLNFMDAEYTDTFRYQIILPLSHELHYHIEDSLKACDLVKVTTTEENNKRIYTFTATPDREGEYPNAAHSWIRLIVTPEGIQPYDHLNDWYLNLVKPNTNLTKEIVTEIENTVADISVDLERIEAVFDLIKERTSYIAIENGIGAVMPRDVNKIWTAQQGDCKDMSNLLCQSLRALGYDAQLALSATIGHSFDLDFPSLSSANHVICVLQHEGEWIYMDATEREGFFGYPSRQIQGRKIFIIDSEKGNLHEVPKVSAEDNRVDHELVFEKKENGLIGDIQYDYYGLSQIDLRSATKMVGNNRLEKHLEGYLERQASNLDYEKVQLEEGAKKCQITASVNSERNFTNIRKKTYLSLAFLPLPHNQHVSEEDTEVHFYKTEDQHFTVLLKFEKPVRLQDFAPVSFEEHGLSFEFNVTQQEPRQITINYHYVNELLFLSNDSLFSFRKINTLITETLRKTIIYEDPT